MKSDELRNILFVLGPSGSGKSTLGTWLAQDLNLLHHEIDLWNRVDGIDSVGIRREWDEFCSSRSASALARTLALQAAEAHRLGVVVTFPSNCVLRFEWLAGARASGVLCVILYGTQEECLAAYRRREAAEPRGIGDYHWLRNNRPVYDEYSDPKYEPWLLSAFDPKGHRSRSSLVAEIRRRLAG